MTNVSTKSSWSGTKKQKEEAALITLITNVYGKRYQLVHFIFSAKYPISRKNN